MGPPNLVMTSPEFLQRLAALVPRPRLHLIRFHGVLAPNAALRSQIVPGESDQARASSNEDGEAPAASTRTRMSWAPVDDWGKLLGDTAAVTAMLDRLLHHAHLLKCGPKSWRSKEKAGLQQKAATS